MNSSTPAKSWEDQACDLLRDIDTKPLESVYCDEGGDAFWADRLPAVRSCGLAQGAALLRHMDAWLGPEQSGTQLRGRSLYVGAGIAELPALVAESVTTEREIDVVNLGQAEMDVLRDAWQRNRLPASVRFVAADAMDYAQTVQAVDHLWCVSVLTDPETYPALSDVSYGRARPWELDGDAFTREQTRVRSLVGALWKSLRLPAIVTTTVEEAPWFLAVAEAASASSPASIEADDALCDTALVEDPLGFLRVRA